MRIYHLLILVVIIMVVVSLFSEFIIKALIGFWLLVTTLFLLGLIGVVFYCLYKIIEAVRR